MSGSSTISHNHKDHLHNHDLEPHSSEISSKTAEPPTGSFPVNFVNSTNGQWSDDEIYVMIWGYPSNDGYHYMNADGTFPHFDHLDANAPGHLTKNGINYPNMSFTLAQASTITIPPIWINGRVYISVGSPMYITILDDNENYVGPDYNNPSDPNYDVTWDFYEFTWSVGALQFGGDPSSVQAFGIPLRMRLQQESSGYDQSAGVIKSRAEIMSAYTSSVGKAFAPLESSSYRILSPAFSMLFQPGGSQGDYMQAYIDQVWQGWTQNGLKGSFGGYDVSATVAGSTLTFTRSSNGVEVDGGTVEKPDTMAVVQGSQTLATGTIPELWVEAQICAAFNRGVAEDTTAWYDASKYFQLNPIKNDYVQFIHSLTADGLAYAFGYDDVNDQSSVKILPNTEPPSLWTLEIGW